MTLRWVASALSDAAGRMRKLRGHSDMKSFISALELHAPREAVIVERKAA
ncbi:MAG TPA: hypothetical protein VGF65_05800 [Mycobacterium sp.]